MTTYTQEEMDEVEAELFEAQELLEKQDTEMKSFNESLSPMRTNSAIILNMIDKLETYLRSTTFSPQLVWELKNRMQELDDKLNNRPKRDRDKMGYPADRIAYNYGSMVNPPPSSFKIPAIV